jgi:E3 ubiquitin-protein ligase RFWD3
MDHVAIDIDSMSNSCPEVETSGTEEEGVSNVGEDRIVLPNSEELNASIVIDDANREAIITGNFGEEPHDQRDITLQFCDGDDTNVEGPLIISTKKLGESENEDVPDGICIICLESWTNFGAHRLCSLRCGHLFGKNCIEEWLKGKNNAGRCPQCNMKARKADIRIIYARKLVALDSTERDAALMEAETEKRRRKLIEKDLNELALIYACMKRENESLKRKLNELAVESIPSSNLVTNVESIMKSPGSDRYVFQRSITVSREVGINQ